jgi:two-component system sensor histidine kinase DesK
VVSLVASSPNPKNAEVPTISTPARQAQGRLRRLNLVAQIPLLGVVGVLLVGSYAQNWWHAVILGVSVVAALVAVVAWASNAITDIRIALPCLVVTGAVWIFGVLVADTATASFGITIVGPLAIPQLIRHKTVAAAGLIAFVGGVGAMRLLVTPGDADVLYQYVLVPTGVTVLAIALMFPNKAFNDLVNELAESREREAALAVDRERIRFASELHDIQGHTLHVVKLKVALAQKLVHSDLPRVEEELREVHALVADTIRQTKALAYAQRRINLSAELENAKNLFEAAGIRVRVDREAEVDPAAGELLGQVLRETTTNILRHAQARQVRITLSGKEITIVNDGAAEDPLPELQGLANLRDRVAGDGGTLTVTQKDGYFTTAAAL